MSRSTRGRDPHPAVYAPFANSACTDALTAADAPSISAGTAAEALIVADRRGCEQEMRRLIDGLGFTASPVTPAMARSVADAYPAEAAVERAQGCNCYVTPVAYSYEIDFGFLRSAGT